MKLFDLLKQFKNIEPDAEFSQHSRTEILLSPQPERRTLGSVFTVLRMIETGAAVAAVGFFIFIVTVSFAPTRSLAPVQYAVIDPAGLHAEAQAIDMQIQLADIVYPQVTSTAMSSQAPPRPLRRRMPLRPALGAQATPSISVPVVPTSTATSTASITPLSIDQVLQQLSQ